MDYWQLKEVGQRTRATPNILASWRISSTASERLVVSHSVNTEKSQIKEGKQLAWTQKLHFTPIVHTVLNAVGSSDTQVAAPCVPPALKAAPTWGCCHLRRGTRSTSHRSWLSSRPLVIALGQRLLLLAQQALDQIPRQTPRAPTGRHTTP